MPSYFCRFTPHDDAQYTLDSITTVISHYTSSYVISYELKAGNNHYHIAVWDVDRTPEDFRYLMRTRLTGQFYISRKAIEDKVRAIAYTIKDGNYTMNGIDLGTIIMANAVKRRKVTFEDDLNELIVRYDPNLYDDRWLAGGVLDLYMKHNRKPYTLHMRVLLLDIKLKKNRHFRENVIDKILAYD